MNYNEGIYVILSINLILMYLLITFSVFEFKHKILKITFKII